MFFLVLDCLMLNQHLTCTSRCIRENTLFCHCIEVSFSGKNWESSERVRISKNLAHTPCWYNQLAMYSHVLDSGYLNLGLLVHLILIVKRQLSNISTVTSQYLSLVTSCMIWGLLQQLPLSIHLIFPHKVHKLITYNSIRHDNFSL